MDITVETIDAKKAKSLLAQNTNNRALSQQRVKQLAGAMKRGEWLLNGEAIKIGETGRLLDGQHRLAAIVDANVPVELVVVRGLADVTQETVDIGTKRSLGDILALRGYAFTSQLASSSRFIWRYDTGNLSGTRSTPTPQQLLSLIEDNLPALQSAAKKASIWYDHVKVSKAVATAAIFILRRIDADDADAFINQVIYGEGLLEGSPALSLRNRLIKESTARPRQRPEYLFAIIIKAWNAWRTDRPVHMLRWRPYGDMSESFPMAA